MSLVKIKLIRLLLLLIFMQTVSNLVKGGERMLTTSDREYWLKAMLTMADPVLESLAASQLKQNIPREVKDRENYSCLEAFARLVSGMAPWIETGPAYGEEMKLRENYSNLIREGIANATNPESSDYMNFSEGGQPIVDTAFLAHAIVRAPNELAEKLDPEVKSNLVKALKMTRTRKPHFSNWLLFSAMIETALFLFEEDWDPMRIDYALKQHEQWYLGDGMYGDGPQLQMDYYNSFVIQPMLVDILKNIGHMSSDWNAMQEKVEMRARRYAVIQERSISPEGTFPITGRSIAYRLGVFQHLAQMALQHNLDETLKQIGRAHV